MELGTGLFTCQRRPDDDRSTADIYDEMLELGRVIDDAGLDSIWVSEHHFLADEYLSGVTPALGALAAVTEDIELGPCIALAPLYDAVRLAEDIATQGPSSTSSVTAESAPSAGVTPERYSSARKWCSETQALSRPASPITRPSSSISS